MPDNDRKSTPSFRVKQTIVIKFVNFRIFEFTLTIQLICPYNEDIYMIRTHTRH